MIDDKIIHAVAKSVRMSERFVSQLDDKKRGTPRQLDPVHSRPRVPPADEYVRHLTKVCGSHGGAWGSPYLGRGSNLILPPEETLRVRFIAPLEVRVRNMMKEACMMKRWQGTRSS